MVPLRLPTEYVLAGRQPRDPEGKADLTQIKQASGAFALSLIGVRTQDLGIVTPGRKSHEIGVHFTCYVFSSWILNSASADDGRCCESYMPTILAWPRRRQHKVRRKLAERVLQWQAWQYGD